MGEIPKEIRKVLFSKRAIKKRVRKIGKVISADYDGKDVVFICILKGASVFFADLIRSLSIEVGVDFMSVSSYGKDVVSSGNIKIFNKLTMSIQGKHVVIIEDIVDSGRTLTRLIQELNKEKPLSIKTAVFLDKKSRREVSFEADYVCFDIPDEFIVGYGLDYAEKYRNLEYVGILDASVYSFE